MIVLTQDTTMGKDKSKDRDARKAGKIAKRRPGIPELEGYCFGHGLEQNSTRSWKKLLTMLG